VSTLFARLSRAKSAACRAPGPWHTSHEMLAFKRSKVGSIREKELISRWHQVLRLIVPYDLRCRLVAHMAGTRFGAAEIDS